MIDLTPTKKLGRLVGFIMGDGNLFHRYRKGVGSEYRIRVSSSKMETPNYFENLVHQVFPNLRVSRKEKKEVKNPPHGKPRECIKYSAEIYTKKLFKKIDDFKRNYRWRIPDFLDTRDSKAGFIGGIFDSDGWMEEDGRIAVSSGIKDNLIHLAELLSLFNINGSLRETYRGQYEIRFKDWKNKVLFFREINFEYPKKKKALINDLKSYKRKVFPGGIKKIEEFV